MDAEMDGSGSGQKRVLGLNIDLAHSLDSSRAVSFRSTASSDLTDGASAGLPQMNPCTMPGWRPLHGRLAVYRLREGLPVRRHNLELHVCIN